MLIALEEEAAIEDHILHSSSDELAWLKVLSSDVQQQNELEDVELSLVNRSAEHRLLQQLDELMSALLLLCHAILRELVDLTAGILAQPQAGVCLAWTHLLMKSRHVFWHSMCHKQAPLMLQPIALTQSLKMLHCWTDKLRLAAQVLSQMKQHCWTEKH